MSLKHLMINYAAYNAWANESYVNWLKNKPMEVLSQEIPSSQNSIVKTMSHILAVQEFWESVICETPLTSGRYITQEFDAEEIFSTIVTQSKALVAFLETLSEEDFMKELHLDTPWVKGTKPRYEFIQHLFNHSTYHRGQVTTIGRNLGITDAPMTDYNFFNMALQKA
jgi:uncharacterized damage-inducible protein DinB